MQSKENNFAHVHDSSKERTERKKIKKRSLLQYFTLMNLVEQKERKKKNQNKQKRVLLNIQE